MTGTDSTGFETHYIIGIDLGTTNSAISFVDLGSWERKGGKPQIKIFSIPQLTGEGEVNHLSVLPSFLYVPGKYDLSKEAIRLPWVAGDENFVGAFARDHGGKVPARLVSSAKSWLCHNKADREAKILPWGSGRDVEKLSPVDATASYLNHIRRAWNAARGDKVELYLENQVVVITVPASFDEVARDLTIAAARKAGLDKVTLIEEPLAAFYSWLIGHEEKWSEYVKPGELILVCDVGGGTTDFTLITLREVDGTPRFERIAVGDHLILGGDNIDLALAGKVEQSFKKKHTLSSDKWKTLCHQCRQAKERILDKGVDSETITLMGEGSSLIAGTLSGKLTREDLTETILEGFFPVVSEGTLSAKAVRKGISEFGLPYEQEPAITRHLGWFLNHHREDVEKLLDKKPVPDLILFNGGSLKPDIIQDRIRESIRSWFKVEDDELPRVLVNPDPDLAVALGASYYGLVKTGRGVRVGSGSPRSYFLGISKKGGEGNADEAICLVERGLEEGSSIELSERKFEVLANQPVSFDVYSSSFRSGDRCGDVVSVDDTFTSLPPIQTIVKYGKKGEKSGVPVQIEAEYTEMGTLSLWCRSQVSQHRWQLQFQLREEMRGGPVEEGEIFDEAVVDEVLTRVTNGFDGEVPEGKKRSEVLTSLVKELVTVMGRSREKWPLSMIRAISDELIRLIETRKASAEVEARWLNLMGFCMRPGFGDGFDEHRIQDLWKIYRAGVNFDKNSQARSEWWIMWRRLAGGLKAGHQRQFLQDITPIILPKKGVKVKITAHERIEIWMAMANMERLLVKDKVKWGRALLAELKPKKTKPQLFWAFSRIGARELLYGPVDRVVPAKEVENWVNTLLGIEWKNPLPVGLALAQLARKTGDRARDLSPETVDRIVDWMEARDNFKKQIRLVTEVVHMERAEESAIFGESLPAGLVLHD